MKKIILLLLISILISSCDVIEAPYKQELTTAGDFEKNVVLFDFTAMYCVFCPAANRRAEALAKLYGEDNVILIGVHSSQLAEPIEEDDIDLRSETSNEIFAKFAQPTTPLPQGMINQLRTEEGILFRSGDWDRLVIEESYKKPELDMEMELQYDNATRTLEVEVDCNYKENVGPDQNITVYITEDSIIARQKDNAVLIEEYEHKHVLRASLTGTFGAPLKSGNIASGETINKKYTYKVPENFRPEKLRVIAFVQDRNTNYIKQATAKYINDKTE